MWFYWKRLKLKAGGEADRSDSIAVPCCFYFKGWKLAPIKHPSRWAPQCSWWTGHFKPLIKVGEKLGGKWTCLMGARCCKALNGFNDLPLSHGHARRLPAPMSKSHHTADFPTCWKTLNQKKKWVDIPSSCMLYRRAMLLLLKKEEHISFLVIVKL